MARRAERRGKPLGGPLSPVEWWVTCDILDAIDLIDKLAPVALWNHSPFTVPTATR